MLHRINLDPNGAEGSSGTAVAEAPSNASPQSDSSYQTSTTSQNNEPDPKRSDEESVADTSAKFEKNPNYKMSQEESDVFERWNKEREKTVSSSPKPKAAQPSPQSQQEPQQSGTIPKGFESLIGDKSPIGAKTMEEIPTKLGELLTKFNEVRGTAGEVGRLKQETEAMRNFLNDFVAGKPEAISFAEKNGLKQSQSSARPQTDSRPQAGTQEDLGRFLDPDLAEYVRDTIEGMRTKFDSELAEIKSKTAGYDEQRDLESARTAIYSDFSAMAEKFDEIRPKNISMRQLWNEYLQGDQGSPVDPRIIPFLEISKIMRDEGVKSSETAYKLWAFERQGKKIIDAETRGRKSVLGHKPSGALSDLQGRTTGQTTTYSHADYEAMSKGKMEIPSSWMDPETGNIQLSKIPADLRDMFKDQYEQT
jgi:hypothetical protein